MAPIVREFHDNYLINGYMISFTGRMEVYKDWLPTISEFQVSIGKYFSIEKFDELYENSAKIKELLRSDIQGAKKAATELLGEVNYMAIKAVIKEKIVERDEVTDKGLPEALKVTFETLDAITEALYMLINVIDSYVACGETPGCEKKMGELLESRK